MTTFMSSILNSLLNKFEKLDATHLNFCDVDAERV